MPDADSLLEKLITFINDAFNLDELADLCVKLGVDFDVLPGGGKRGKARELVLYLNRRGRLSELQKVLADERPEQYKKTFGLLGNPSAQLI